MSRILELFGISTRRAEETNWATIAEQQRCPYLKRKCIKVRKSAPDISIGTCTVLHGRHARPVIICPHRFLERQVFTDCLHLLALHEPGNELHVVSEITIPGGSVDYFLVSARQGKVKDFAGIELQTVDTTGTLWPERQGFLREQGVAVDETNIDIRKGYGMNWKMTAKTALVQLHHKVQTFENISKHLVLVVQDCFLDYMRKGFQFEHLVHARLGDSMHIHVYGLIQTEHDMLRLELGARFSTDAEGIARSLGLQAEPKIELEEIIRLLETKIAKDTLFFPVGTS